MLMTRVQQPESETSQPAGDATLKWFTLRLAPASVEQEFWNSVSPRLRLLDVVGLSSSTFITVMIIRRIGWFSRPDWLFHFLPTATYLVAGLVQLALFLSRPALHQRHRLWVNLANRLARAVTVTWAARSMANPRVMLQFMGVLNSAPGAAAAAPGSHLATAAALRILRTAAGIPLLWVSHAVNYLVPFWVMLPLQLYTLAVAVQILPAISCALQHQPVGVVEAVHVLAGRVGLLVRAVRQALVPPGIAWQEQRQQQQPDLARDVLLMLSIAFSLILLVAPCLVAYCVECKWKADFLHNRRTSSSSTGRRPPAEALLPRDRPLLGWVAFDILCLTCTVCEVLANAWPVASC